MMSFKSLIERLVGLTKSEKLDEIYDDFENQSKEIIQEIKETNPTISNELINKIRDSIVKKGTSKFMDEHGNE